MARTITAQVVFQAGFNLGVSITTETIRQVTLTVPTVEGKGVSIESTNPWPSLAGKYRNDSTWEGFDDFLREYQQQMNQTYSESENL